MGLFTDTSQTNHLQFGEQDKSFKGHEVRRDSLYLLIDQMSNISPVLFGNNRKSSIDLLLQRYSEQTIDDIDWISSINLLSEISASFIWQDIDYDYLAGRLVIFRRILGTILRYTKTSDLIGILDGSTPIRDVLEILDETREVRINSISGISDVVKTEFQKYHVDYMKDLSYDYLGALTLDRAYLLDNEMIQDMLLRVSIGIHKTGDNDQSDEEDENILNTYELMSDKMFIHASPTLFHAGTRYNQLSSCYLMNIKGDSLDKIFETISDSAIISKYAGGIGISISSIRARGSKIGTTGSSNGIVPMLKVFNETAKYVDQGGGKRKGAISIYLEPWHADIEEFLRLGSKHESEDNRAADLFYALWVPDIFMERVLNDQEWSLFCPNTIYLETGEYLWDKHGDEFNRLYRKCEDLGLATRTVKARDIWDNILRSQIESGSPYILYKDTCNSRSNHQHLGTIKSSNLCTEIIQYTDNQEIAVCTLSSVSLPSVVKDNHQDIPILEDKIDWSLLRRIVRQITINLDKIVDINNYPLDEAKRSADKHRAIGIGIQGLSDVFCKLSLPFDSEDAMKLNRLFAEHIYYYSLEKSIELAEKYGEYESFKGSQFSKGILQFDYDKSSVLTLDWDKLKRNMMKYGVRNSLLTAYMPTASTSQILGNNEGFEPYSSNLYNRKTLSGDFTVINKHLVRDLTKLGMWNKDIYENIMLNNGSVQQINDIPEYIKKIYRTSWELPIGPQLLMARDRGHFIDQSQSMSLYFPDSEDKNDRLTSSLINGWKLGLKTGIYYVRTRPAVHPIKFTVSRAPLCRTKEECISCQG